MLVFEERGKPEYPEKDLLEQGREPTPNSTHMMPRPGIEPQVGYSGINVTGGGGGGGFRRIFLGLKFSTPVFFWVEDLTVYSFGLEKSNFHQANNSS